MIPHVPCTYVSSPGMSGNVDLTPVSAHRMLASIAFIHLLRSRSPLQRCVKRLQRCLPGTKDIRKVVPISDGKTFLSNCLKRWNRVVEINGEIVNLRYNVCLGCRATYISSEQLQHILRQISSRCYQSVFIIPVELVVDKPFQPCDLWTTSVCQTTFSTNRDLGNLSLRKRAFMFGKAKMYQKNRDEQQCVHPTI